MVKLKVVQHVSENITMSQPSWQQLYLATNLQQIKNSLTTIRTKFNNLQKNAIISTNLNWLTWQLNVNNFNYLSWQAIRQVYVSSTTRPSKKTTSQNMRCVFGSSIVKWSHVLVKLRKYMQKVSTFKLNVKMTSEARDETLAAQKRFCRFWLFVILVCLVGVCVCVCVCVCVLEGSPFFSIVVWAGG